MRSVIITGGTGTFGRAFVKRLLQDDKQSGDSGNNSADNVKQPGGFVKTPIDLRPDRIVVYSRGEHAQADMAAELAPLDRDRRLRFFVGDVRDRDRLRRAFTGCDTVIHAAALKRIEVGQYNPAEMVKTNVLGAMNVIEAAIDAGIEKVVALSTDKAWQPVSPYGQSKALAEALFLNAHAATGAHGTQFSVTRYGNVAGASGSVIPKWRALIARGATVVPVTSPDATRYWMTIGEAVELVIEAVHVYAGGQVVTPELPAFRLGDLAEAMGVGMNVTGLPEWEKLHEGIGEGETSDQARRLSVGELRERLAAL